MPGEADAAKLLHLSPNVVRLEASPALMLCHAPPEHCCLRCSLTSRFAPQGLSFLPLSLVCSPPSPPRSPLSILQLPSPNWGVFPAPKRRRLELLLPAAAGGTRVSSRPRLMGASFIHAQMCSHLRCNYGMSQLFQQMPNSSVPARPDSSCSSPRYPPPSPGDASSGHPHRQHLWGWVLGEGEWGIQSIAVPRRCSTPGDSDAGKGAVVQQLPDVSWAGAASKRREQGRAGRLRLFNLEQP